ncbi:MAG: MGMT family protein, partial [Chloroflexi bacterium]|nr:MGMT family protein [Chloroflexota bacterium]
PPRLCLRRPVLCCRLGRRLPAQNNYIARRYGMSMRWRTSTATNPAAVVIPCHRVVRGDGGLGWYRWGLSRKKGVARS